MLTELRNEALSPLDNHQDVLDHHHQHRHIAMLESHILAECADVEFADTDADDESISDPRKALLHFMAVATPHQHVVDDIANRFPEIIENMFSTFETHLVGDHAVVMELIDNVPDTVNPVKAKLTYVQVPDIEGGSTALRLAWRVSVGNTHRVLSLTTDHT